MSDDRLMQILIGLAILLFVSVAVLPLARSRYPWTRWAKWGSVAVFSMAILYAVGMILSWALRRND